ncbi:MAG: 3-methyl-2-oxobutanoate hydroxymethyltransferase [Spirochaetia bacterium]|nr:3-methyl-2-oxobutanoate hydroxymethyltransferase [Spirochaetia bacterium]
MKFQHLYILVLGSNLGDKPENIRAAIKRLEQKGLTVIRTTDACATSPEMVKTQPDFINVGVLLQSDLSPADLLEIVQKTEIETGRSRSYRYGPREIDIDIVWWSAGEYRSQNLEIPHIWNNARSWVRKILAELLPQNHEQAIYYKNMNTQPIKTISDFKAKKKASEKIVMLTAYDFTIAKVMARTSLDVLLVGDSLGNVFQGGENTLCVTMDDMVYHGRAVKKGAPDKFIIMDMPFLSYHTSEEQAVANAGRLIRETGASAVKLEGGIEFMDVIRKIIRAGIPVMGHLGLMPQSVLKTGGYRLQAKNPDDRDKLIQEAIQMQDAGIFALVVEMIPYGLGEDLAAALEIPVIGIGAGPEVDGQVLVINDLLGLDADFSARFVRKYMDGYKEIFNAIENFSGDVRQKNYPSGEEFYKGE